MEKYFILKTNLEKYGLMLITQEKDFKSVKQMVIVSNGQYSASVKAENYINNKEQKIPIWFAVKNPFILENINKYLEINKEGHFKCISNRKEIIDRKSILKFVCTRCGTIVEKSLSNLMRHDNQHKGISCPNCDDTLESLHALVLKQLFKHFYPDSIEEDKSCINPNTGKVMPTDIVNHSLKIAIEIQGQWHRFDNQKVRDNIKKEYWINRGYKFYDYKIDGVSVLEYAQYFFPDLKEIPSWIKMDYNKKLNLIDIQKKLDSGMKVQAIAKQLSINAHRIYDAIQENKLYYPDEYIKNTRKSIVMLDMHRNYQKEYNSYTDAAKENNIDLSGIISCIYTESYYSNGHFWIPKDLYESGNYNIPKNRLEKFYQPVKKIDGDNKIIAVFDDMFQAAKDVGTIASKIYEVVRGDKKTTKGFHYEYV